MTSAIYSAPNANDIESQNVGIQGTGASGAVVAPSAVALSTYNDVETGTAAADGGGSQPMFEADEQQQAYDGQFRDYMCCTIWTMLCIPGIICSCVGIFFQQKAAEKYWIGDYISSGVLSRYARIAAIASLITGFVVIIALFVMHNLIIALQDVFG